MRREERIPLFPLHTVLLPGVHLPLHIFEPRYRQLIRELISGELPGREFGVLAIRNALVNEVGGIEQVHEIGCVALLREARPQDGGRYDIVTTGSHRFRLRELITDEAPYLLGDVQWLADVGVSEEADAPEEAPPTAVVVAAARAAHERYCESAWADGDWSTPPEDTPVERLAYLLAADCLLPLADRQALLAEPDPIRRLGLTSVLLNREAGFLVALGAVPVQHGELGDLGAHAKLN
ncbi:MAG: LON peptidase substrate-binding domain-containing protein [Thermocrispum sp.]